MQIFLAKSIAENNLFWFLPVAVALACVLAAETVCIVLLVRRVLSAKQEKEQKGETDFFSAPMAVLFAAPTLHLIQAQQTWLLVLGILALVGAVALAGLILVCYLKGYLFVRAEKLPQPKINVFDFLPKQTPKKPEQPKKSAGDINSAIAAFAAAPVEEEEEQPPVPAFVYQNAPLSEEESELEEEDEQDLSDADFDGDEDFDGIEESDDPELFTGTERVIGYDAETDSNIVARYRKSFEAKLSQSEPQIKRYYSAIKNALLSYKGTKSRMSWTADSFHNGRTQLAKINVKTRILEMYLALDPATLEGTVYRGQDVGALKKYEETPFRYKIRTPRKFNWALELVHRVCEEHGLTPIDIEPVDYENQYPFDTMDNLVKRKLVKVTTRLEKVSNTFEFDGESNFAPAEPYLPQEPAQEAPNWEPDTETAEEEAAPAYGDMQYAEEEEPDVSEEDAVPAYAQTEAKPTWGEQLSYEDQQTEAPPIFEEQQAGAEFAPTGRNVDPELAQIDVALLDTHFRDGDLVTLAILKRRGLVFSGATRLKIRATGKMSRQLTIVANQFTYDALLAISEAGGDAQFIR